MVKQKRSGESGFTLLEVLIATAISMLVAATIYSVYISQMRTQVVQDSLLDIQQNLRATLFLMGLDVRKAGYQGAIVGTINIAAINEATDTILEFTYVANEDGIDNDDDDEIDEFNELSTIRYEFGLDGNDLMRTKDEGLNEPSQVVAKNIENVEFLYILNDDTETIDPVAAELQLIRGVHVTLLARSPRQDPKFIDTRPFPRPSGESDWGPVNDRFHRKLLTGTFFMRNMGN